jgi:hypothetical protein
MAEAPDEEVDRLYGLALEEFIPARDALAKELRSSGRRGEATAIKALKKPTVAAWAANQAVRSQPRAARELWEAGDALAAAQEAVLAGKGSGGDLRAAAERERLALDPLVDAARGLLTSSGGDLSDTTIDRVRATLQAAAIDADVREEVAGGRAVREREPRGLFGGEAAAPTSGRDRSASDHDRSPAPDRGRSSSRGRSASDRDRSAGTGTEGKASRGGSAGSARGRSASDRDRSAAPDRRGSSTRGRSGAPDRDRSAADAAREREEAAAARKREREEKAARERARKAAAARVARAENALAAAEARSAKAAEALEDARAREREAVEALADARAELRAAER